MILEENYTLSNGVEIPKLALSEQSSSSDHATGFEPGANPMLPL